MTSAQTLSAQSLANLEAFVRLLGYVRYFHPSDQVAAADWEAFTLRHILQAEEAATERELMTVLKRIFAPYAPTLGIYLAGEEPPLHEALQPPTGLGRVRMWVHSPHGDGSGYAPPVRLTGIPGTTPTEALPSGVEATVELPFPHEVVHLALNGSLQASLALTLYEDDGGTLTLPHATGTPEAAAGSVSGATGEATASDRALRLSVVALAWNHYRHFFPYFGQVDTDWDALLPAALARAAQDDAASFTATFRWLNAQLRDAHNFSDLKDEPAQHHFRPPFRWRTVEGLLTVVHTDEVGPLAVSDVVIGIGGLPSGAALEREEALLSQTGDVARRYAENIVLSGDENTRLELEAETAAGEVRSVAVRRTVDRRGRTPVPTDNRPLTTVARLGRGVVYLDLTRLDDDTDVYTGEGATHDLSALVALLAGAEGLVFDMRGYPGWTLPMELLGHLTDEPLRTAPMYMPVITRPDAEMALVDVTYEWAQPQAPWFTDKVVFLIDSLALSRAEHILAMVEGHKLGELLGTTTAGANGTYAGVTFYGRYASSWTSLQANRFGNEQLFARGIPPTIPVERTLTGVRAGRDEQLERAFAHLTGLPAGAMRVEPLDLPGAPAEP